MTEGQAATNARLNTLEDRLSDIVHEGMAGLRTEIANLHNTIVPQLQIIIEALEQVVKAK